MKLRIVCVVVGFLSLVLSWVQVTVAQTSTQTASALPRLVRFGGTAKDLNGNPLTGVVGITFALYSEPTGSASLWLETQNVTADSNGHYTVLLGSTKPDGLPAELFTSEQAHWVGVQVSGQAEQLRVRLVSAPYALKAGDAETIGGLPPSAFVLAATGFAAASSPAANTTESVSPATATDVTTTGGAVGSLPAFNSATTIIDSVVFQTGTGATGKIGIGTTKPGATLDVKGTTNVEGLLTLPATGVATATAGTNSQPQNFVASSFNSTSSTAENQTFQWQAEPAANDTASPSGTLNLLYGLGTAAPSETGLKLSSKGLFTFATGQTFPGTGNGDGTVTSVASGAGLTGGPITSSGTLSIASGGVTNAMLENSSLTVTAGTDLTGGGSVILGSTTTLNLDTTKVPQLATANTFTGSVNMVSDTRVDFNGLNKGSTSPAIRFGTGNTGEAISSDRAGTVNVNGIDLYTNFTPRLSVTNSGSVGIGTQAPGSTLDVRGSGSFSNGVSGASSAAGANGVYGNNSATSGASNGVYGSTSSPAGAGVMGVSLSSGGAAVYGQSNTSATGAMGVYGTTASHVAGSAGVYGSASGFSAGVFGQNGTLSETASSLESGAGVSGDGGVSGGQNIVGVQGTADDGIAGFFQNNSPSGYYTVTAASYNSAVGPFIAGSASPSFGIFTSYCDIDSGGDLNCTGTKNAVVPIDGGARRVALSAIESPKNWFEDFGSAQLSSGSAVVAIDPEFAQTVNTETDYMVIPVPNGDCKGLYVTNKMPTSFEVRELGGGSSSIRFDYRIVVLRKNYENVRFADHTHDVDPEKMMLKHGQPGNPRATPASVRESALARQR